MPLEVGIGGLAEEKEERKGVDSPCGKAAFLSWLWFTLYAG